jgi:hypothetical protein
MIYKAFAFSDDEIAQLKAADPAMKKLVGLTGISWLYKIPGALSKSDFERIAERLSPNGTLASLYLWEIGDLGLYRYNNVFEAGTDK